MALIFILGIPLIAALLSFFTATTVATLGTIAVTASIIELAAALSITSSIGLNAPYMFTTFLGVDHLGAIPLVLLVFGGFVASIYARGYTEHEISKEIIGFNRAKKLFAQLHLFLLAMSLAIVTTNPILTWIAIEATTLTTAFLISFYNKPSAMEAAWKYLILNSVGLLLAFFGTLLFMTPELKGAHTGLASWSSLLSGAASYDPFIVKMAFLFTLIGYGTKVGLVPMHTWLPDAHSKAPSPISSLLSGVLLNIPLLAILRFKIITDAVVETGFTSGLLITFGIFSLIVSAAIILVQKNYKRLLAYSSIEHMGIATLGFGLGGSAAYASLLHMIYHSLTKSLLFFSAGNVFLKYSTTKIENVRGMVSVLPITGPIFFFGVLTIIGMPPMGMFFTEFSILARSLTVHPAITVGTTAALIIVGIGFIRHIADMSFGEPTGKLPSGEQNAWTIIPLIILAATLLVASIYLPAGIQTFIARAASTL